MQLQIATVISVISLKASSTIWISVSKTVRPEMFTLPVVFLSNPNSMSTFRMTLAKWELFRTTVKASPS